MLLNVASRHTPAANVSLLLLLETVLGPVWVWVVIGEAMTLPMIAGGTVVVASLLLYIVASARMLPSDTSN
jgi:drug/metabolite transporter (DMT)-like permease